MIDGKAVILQSGEEIIISSCGHCGGTGTCTRGWKSAWSGETFSCADCILEVYQKYNDTTKKRRVKCSACDGKGKVRL
jgi:RecJ-like exonuclease